MDRYINAALCASYIVAGVIANLLVYQFGQAALLVTAVVLMPADFLARDILHHRWEARGKVAMRMGLLILGSAACTYLCNPAASRVAMASAIAFAVAGSVDAIVYAMGHKHTRFVRMNVSNIVGAISDSIVFPIIAFGGFSVILSLSQAALKIVGGLVLSAVFLKAKGEKF